MSERRWSDQFLGVLEALRMPDQFRQGRRYARAGRVHQLTISTSLVSALVGDEDGQTYRTRIAIRAFRDEDWKRIERAVAGQAMYLAKLLAGQFPDALDRLVAEFGLDLFPQEISDLAMACPCLDWRVPCHHLSATCYVLAESFDHDPFGILAWRGRGRDELLNRLRSLRVEPAPIEAAPAESHAAVGFWTAGPRVVRPPAAVPAAVRRPDALLDQLDHLALDAGRYPVVDLLRPAYHAVARGES